MDRIYDQIVRDHFASHRQMLFLSGPRQVGKTTVARGVAASSKSHRYFNWDNDVDRRLLLGGTDALAAACGLDRVSTEPVAVVFDELHKFRRWKGLLKGFFDTYERKIRVVVTGSARLTVFQRGGDSLMGRYFLFRVHPLTLREIADPSEPKDLVRPPLRPESGTLERLFRFGGFPEPYLKQSDRFYRQWKNLRRDQLFREDIRDLTAIREITQIQLLALMLQERAAQLINYSALSKHVQVSLDSVLRWCATLDGFYYCFFVRPYSRNVTRSLLKEPKVYLWDWSLVQDTGARWENLVASHLLKAVQFWNDSGRGDFALHFIRDKEQREVDFLVVRDRQPWILVEVKTSDNEGISPALRHFQKQLKAPHAFQVTATMGYLEVDCFTEHEPIKVPLVSLLSQLI